MSGKGGRGGIFNLPPVEVWMGSGATHLYDWLLQDKTLPNYIAFMFQHLSTLV